jgi:outer membrane protein OmpA-like peptidoglycan-associated protein
MISIFCSLGVHVILILLFSDIHIALPVVKDARDTLFHVPQVEIDRSILDAPVPNTDLPDSLDPENAKQIVDDPKLDILDLQGAIPDDREIKFTPEVAQPENLAASSPAGLEALESLDTEMMDKTLESLSDSKPTLPDPSTPLSENQPIIATDPSALDEDKASKLLKDAAKDREGISDRYHTVGELIGLPGSKVTDLSKPIYMPTDLLFDFAEWRLRPGAKASMMMLGILIDRNPDTVFIIEGYTDTIGSEESNLRLSRKRAEAVRDWLQESLRLDPGRLRVSAMGETHPIVSPRGSAEEQQPNRRVEIRMVKAGESTARKPDLASPPPVPAPVTPVPAPAPAPVSPTPEPPVRPAVPVTPPAVIRPAVPVRPAAPVREP